MGCMCRASSSVKKTDDRCKDFFTCDASETKFDARVLKLVMAQIVQIIRSGNNTDFFGSDDMKHEEITLGDVIEAFYSELVQEYGDEDLAEVVAATLINEMILSGLRVDKEIAAA